MDTLMTTAEQKKIIILYRAVKFYVHFTVQNVVRFLSPRVDYVVEDGYEFECAHFWWWETLDDIERQKLEVQYKFAAKIFE